jgi:hypothetical protein
LLKDAYEESKNVFEIKIPSWYGSITLLIKNIRGLKELSDMKVLTDIINPAEHFCSYYRTCRT